jgi:hypothetical protein
MMGAAEVTGAVKVVETSFQIDFKPNRLLKNQPKLRWFPLSVDLWDHDRQT